MAFEIDMLKKAFDEIGVNYIVQTHNENSDVGLKHTALFVEDFLFIFDTKSGIFFDTRNLGNE